MNSSSIWPPREHTESRWGISGHRQTNNVVATTGDCSLHRQAPWLTRRDADGLDILAGLGLLHELLPGAVRFALLVTHATTPGEATIAEAKSAAAAIGKQIEVLSATTKLDIDAAFARITQDRADALLVAPQILFTTRRIQLLTLAARHAVPTMYYQREFVEAGGLMSYGSSIIDRERQLGVYTGRVLKGEKPSDLPVLRAVKFEFVVNLQTAKTIGLTVPPTLLARADEVIE